MEHVVCLWGRDVKECCPAAYEEGRVTEGCFRAGSVVGTWAVGTPLLSGGVWVFAVAGGGFLLLGCGTSLSGIASAGLRYCPWLVLVGWLE